MMRRQLLNLEATRSPSKPPRRRPADPDNGADTRTSAPPIFLSAFVMIGQNRQAVFQQATADHDFVEQELETNTELTRAVHALTTEIHRRLITAPDPRSTGDR